MSTYKLENENTFWIPAKAHSSSGKPEVESKCKYYKTAIIIKVLSICHQNIVQN